MPDVSMPATWENTIDVSDGMMPTDEMLEFGQRLHSWLESDINFVLNHLNKDENRGKDVYSWASFIRQQFTMAGRRVQKKMLGMTEPGWYKHCVFTPDQLQKFQSAREESGGRTDRPRLWNNTPSYLTRDEGVVVRKLGKVVEPEEEFSEAETAQPVHNTPPLVVEATTTATEPATPNTTEAAAETPDPFKADTINVEPS